MGWCPAGGADGLENEICAKASRQPNDKIMISVKNKTVGLFDILSASLSAFIY